MTQSVYEGMFILDSAKFAQNPEATQKEVFAILERTGASMLASRPWQDAKLMYPIKKQKKGLYFLTYFRMDTQNLVELNRLCRLNETVLRQLILAVDPALVDPLVALAKGEGGTYSTFTDTEAMGEDGRDAYRGGGRDRGERDSE